jgi:2-keto-4-pentenoate hydratase
MGDSRSGIRDEGLQNAAHTLWQCWSTGTRIDQLPAACRPRDRAEGYAIQAEVARLSTQRVFGWKIAATSVAGQKHIGVDGPLAGRLLSERVLPPGAVVSLERNHMRVAEGEFAFRMARSLPPRQDPYSEAEVLAAVASLHVALELPDSRYEDFARVGAAQLIADTACACWVIIGPEVRADWRASDLSAHEVRIHRNGSVADGGRGANVLGDPRTALTWIANELRTFAGGLHDGDVVITGTCVPPVFIIPGDRLCVDFGAFGTIEATCSG